MLEHLALVDAARRPHVGVGVHVSRHHGLAGDVEHPGALGSVEVCSHGGDPVVLDEDVPALDDLLAIHGEDPCGVLQQDAAVRAGARFGDHRLEGVGGEVLLAADGGGVLAVDAVPERPDHRVARGGPGEVVAALGRHFADRDGGLAAADLDLQGVLPEGRDLDEVVAVLELEERPVAVRREHDLPGGGRVRAGAAAGDLEVRLPVGSVELQ